MHSPIIGTDFPIDWLHECGLTLDSTIDEAIESLMWGTYGPYYSQPLTYVKLKDCSTDHLINIMRTQPHVNDIPIFRLILVKILNRRGLNQSGIFTLMREMPYEQLKIAHHQTGLKDIQ